MNLGLTETLIANFPYISQKYRAIKYKHKYTLSLSYLAAGCYQQPAAINNYYYRYY